MIRVEPSIAQAVADNRPVVALETAVLTHGLAPELAATVYREMMTAVVQRGALPAPVGVIAGELVVGLTEEELDRLAQGEEVRKAAVADLAPLAAGKADAGTTVGASLWGATRTARLSVVW